MSRDDALRAFERTGLLWVQGQGELDSLADLIAGEPVTTRGYSWDYVPAWTLRDELDARDDVAVVKLVRGRSTVVQARHWPALEAMSRAARPAVADSPMLRRISAVPGIAGKELKGVLGLGGKDGSRRFQKGKTELELALAIVGREQEDPLGHTHDPAWFPWSHSKVARGVSGPLPTIEDAVASLGIDRAFLPVLKNLR